MLNIVIPMAGNGERFRVAGFQEPKPLIPINGKPMIKHVVNTLRIRPKNSMATYHYICQKEHHDKYKLAELLPDISFPNKCTITLTDTVTQGTACSVLLAENHIDNDDELFIANSDQWFDWSPEHFLQWIARRKPDGALLTMYGTHPKWSYCRLDEQTQEVIEVAEKNPISSIANVGVYYFRTGKSYVRAAQQMIAKDIRVNGEFFCAPVYNEIIQAGGKVLNYPVAEFHGLGVPEDLEKFIKLQIIR